MRTSPASHLYLSLVLAWEAILVYMQVSGYASLPDPREDNLPVEATFIDGRLPVLTRNRKIALALCSQLSIYWRHEMTNDPSMLAYLQS